MQRAGVFLARDFINRMIALGYKADPDGMCFGTAFMGMLTILEGNPGKFNNILLEILNLTPVEQAAIKNKRTGADKTVLSVKERDIVALCDGIELFHMPDKYKKLLTASDEVVTQNQHRALEFLATNKLLSEGGVKEKEEFLDVYTLPELTSYLSTLKQSIIDTKCAQPFAIIVESSNHTVCIHYNAKKNAWIMIDPAKLPIHEIHDDKLMAESLFESFYGTEKIIISSTIFMTQQNEAAINPCLDEWRSRMNSREEVRHDKANSQDSFGANWLYLAVQKGREKLVRKLLETGANVDQAPKETGVTPLYMAVQEDRLTIIDDLLLYGANPNIYCKAANGTPLGHALDSKNWLVASAILIGLWNTKQIKNSDMTIIHQNRHALAEGFCQLMGHEKYREHYAELTKNVLTSRNALGIILHEPTNLGAFLLSSNRYHGKKVTESIKLIGDWFDGKQKEGPPVSVNRLVK